MGKYIPRINKIDYNNNNKIPKIKKSGKDKPRMNKLDKKYIVKNETRTKKDTRRRYKLSKGTVGKNKLDKDI